MTDPLVNMHEMVERFNRDLVGIDIPELPRMLRADRMGFRARHMQEELDETRDAYELDDFHGVVDGLLDLVYVALGSLVEMGICVNGAFEEVHRANMRKVRGVPGDNEKRPMDTVVKPRGWKPADLHPYLTVTYSDLDRIRDEKAVTRLVGPDRNPRRKILVLGHARHGKDTVSDIMTQWGLEFTSSSMFCAEHVMMPLIGEKYGYTSVEQCFEDRGNHRAEWYDAIRDYNRPDASALGRAIFERHDIYCGLRSKAEFNALKNAGVFDVAVWVDASDRVPPEGRESCTVEPWMADYVVDNNGSEIDLAFNVDVLMGRIMRP